jgi:aminodeoxyfutalosine synthase
MAKLPTDQIHNRTLQGIAEKVFNDIPVDPADAHFMLATNDILELGLIAHYMKTRLHGDKAFYGVNMNINYTNICELRCPLCAFSKDEGDDAAFILSLDEIEEKAREAVSIGVDEVHIVGGLCPKLKIDYFTEMLERIKRVKPDIFIVAFTATEYDYFAKLNNLSLEEVFQRMIKSGLGALPGGGAEIFSPRVRDRIAPRKISGRQWLHVMKTAHLMGLKSNATMLFNHLENSADIIDHLEQIRSLQNQTGGFKTFVPLLYHDSGTKIPARRRSTTGYDDVRLYATSRIYLHNIPHLKALWMYLGDKMAQVLLRFGVDDIGATYHNEKVVHAAGAQTPDYGSESFLRFLIEDAGMTPVRVTANYQAAKTGSFS